MSESLIAWQSPEFEYRKKTADWYWAVWIIVVSLAVIAVIFNDILLAIVIFIGAFCLTLLSSKQPRLIQYELTANGIRVEDTLYPYNTLVSFDVAEYKKRRPRLLVKSRKLLTPLLVIQIDGVHPQEIREILGKRLSKEEINEPLTQIFFEFLGF